MLLLLPFGPGQVRLGWCRSRRRGMGRERGWLGQPGTIAASLIIAIDLDRFGLLAICEIA